MSTLVTILHVVVCLFLMLTVLLQQGKGGGMGGAFGGSNAGSVFGGAGFGCVVWLATRHISVEGGADIDFSRSLAYR